MIPTLGFDVTVNPSFKELGEGGRAGRLIMRDVHSEVGSFWWEKMLPDHWREGASQRYGYAPRSKKYLRQKIRAAKSGKALAGGLVALLYSGDTRARVLAAVKLSATAKEVKIRMSASWYVGMVPKKTKHPNMGAEITATTDQQRQAMAGFMRDRIVAKINALNLPDRQVWAT